MAICSLQRAAYAVGCSLCSIMAPPWGVVSMHSIPRPPRFVKRAAPAKRKIQQGGRIGRSRQAFGQTRTTRSSLPMPQTASAGHAQKTGRGFPAAFCRRQYASHTHSHHVAIASSAVLAGYCTGWAENAPPCAAAKSSSAPVAYPKKAFQPRAVWIFPSMTGRYFLVNVRPRHVRPRISGRDPGKVRRRLHRRLPISAACATT